VSCLSVPTRGVPHRSAHGTRFWWRTGAAFMLKARIDALIAEEAALASKAAEEPSQAPSAADVAEWAAELSTLLRAGSAQQRKALFRLLIKELRVMSREEILPTYRVPPVVRAPNGQVVPTGFEPVSPP
jgi:hypothetical protein